MTPWLWIALVANLVYWSAFAYLAKRHHARPPRRAALAVGVLHMLFATPLVVAPIRSLLDPHYVGYQLGLVRFEGRAAFVPATLFLAWALASAWIAVTRRFGRPMYVVAAGDALFALNFGAEFVRDGLRDGFRDSTFQAGEHFTIAGPIVAIAVLAVFALPLVASGIWAVRRGR
jgi:hypothetical protein